MTKNNKISHLLKKLRNLTNVETVILLIIFISSCFILLFALIQSDNLHYLNFVTLQMLQQ